MLSRAFYNSWFLSTGRTCRIMLSGFTDPILLGNKEALAYVWRAKVMIDHFLACKKCSVTTTTDIVTEFLQIWLTTVHCLL